MRVIRTITPNNHERGFVSIFSVIFFIIVATIITTGFLRIALWEGRQATDNSSANSALAAARSGIEDGKRALLLYARTTDVPLKTALQSAIASQGCTDIFANPAISAALKIPTNGKIETQNLDEQYYTCLTMQPYTDNYESVVAPGKSVIVPLQSQGDFSTVTIRWHKLGGTDGILQPSLSVPGTDNPAIADFPDKLPTFLRLQIIAVPTGSSASVNNIRSATGFLRTTTVGAAGAPVGFMTDDNSYPKLSAGTAPCVTALMEYACNVTLSGTSGTTFLPANTAAYTYYLRLTSLYKSVHFQVVMQDPVGGAVKFSMVQPEIDSTGKSGSTLRRIKARVKLINDAYLPEYTAEAFGDGGDGKICKAFSVSSATIIDDPTGQCILP